MRLIPRKRMIVDRQSQGAMILRMVVYWIFSVISVGLLMLLADLGRGPVGPFFDPAHFEALRDKYTMFMIAALLVLPVIVADIWKQSNRYAGPVFRARRCLRDIAAGEPVEHVAFRKKDYWPDLAKDLNGVIDYVARLKDEAPDINRRPKPQAEVPGELAGTASGHQGAVS